MAVVTKPLSPEVTSLVESALAELKRRKVLHDRCPRCEVFDWNVDIVTMPAYPVTKPVLGETRPGYLPTLIMLCKNCGYTMLHNLNVLNIKVTNL
jgi:predicted nucleic-acid-binding Zn-ribbon protein